MKVTDKQIADHAGRSPQVISAMKKSYPKQYELLKAGVYCIENGVLNTKEYKNMNWEEILKAQENLTSILLSTAEELKTINLSIADGIDQ